MSAILNTDQIYSFVFRGLLADSALDHTQRSRNEPTDALDPEVSKRLPIDALDRELVRAATRMATIYVAIASFENSVRAFVSKRLLESEGADWWTNAVSEKIRKRADSRRDEEKKVRWHTPRGDEPINYTEFGDLADIIAQNWERFEDHIETQDWARHVIDTVERSRNVIMHSGELVAQDIERVGTAIRDWIRQVGT